MPPAVLFAVPSAEGLAICATADLQHTFPAVEKFCMCFSFHFLCCSYVAFMCLIFIPDRFVTTYVCFDFGSRQGFRLGSSLVPWGSPMSALVPLSHDVSSDSPWTLSVQILGPSEAAPAVSHALPVSFDRRETLNTAVQAVEHGGTFPMTVDSIHMVARTVPLVSPCRTSPPGSGTDVVPSPTSPIPQSMAVLMDLASSVGGPRLLPNECDDLRQLAHRIQGRLRTERGFDQSAWHAQWGEWLLTRAYLVHALDSLAAEVPVDASASSRDEVPQ